MPAVTLRASQRYVSCVAAVLALMGAVAAGWGATQFSRRQLVEYATFVAGIAGPLWTAASVLLVYLAYLAQREQLDQQQLEIRTSADELAAQNIDRTIYSLLDIRLRIVDGIQIRTADPTILAKEHPENYDIFGRAAIAELLANLWSGLREGEDLGRLKDGHGYGAFDLVSSLRQGYAKFYQDWREFLAPLNSNALLLLRVAHAAPEHRRADYLNILKAHISPDETALLAHHVWLYDVSVDRSALCSLVAQLFFPGCGAPYLLDYSETMALTFPSFEAGTA